MVDQELAIQVARIETELKNIAKASELAYVELQRRLDTLNHAHENMVSDRSTFLRADVHDRFYTEFAGWRDNLNTEIARKLAVVDFDKRNDEVSKWRDEINKIVNSKMSTVDFDDRHSEISDRVGKIENVLSNLQGRVAAYISIVGVIVIMIQILLHYSKVK